LLKTAESDEVREAVRRVHAGELVFPPALAEIVLDELRQKRPEPAERNAFRREGDVWTITYEGEMFRLRDTRGVRYLARLVEHPGREFHSLDLVAMDRASPGVAPDKGAGPALDREAKKAYAARIRDLEDELEEAQSFGDNERASRAGAEIDAIKEQLSSAVGLGGRDRSAASASERARVSVTLAIKATLKKITEHAPALSEHFATTIHTGIYCSYTPDPRAPITWR
jgi:hypothetical protein